MTCESGNEQREFLKKHKDESHDPHLTQGVNEPCKYCRIWTPCNFYDTQSIGQTAHGIARS